MVKCKKCKSENIVKNGKVRGKQRYLCKDCRYNFVEGDARTNEKIKAKKAMCVLQYGQGKASFNMLAKIYDTWPSLVYRWVKEAAEQLPKPEIAEDTKETPVSKFQATKGGSKSSLYRVDLNESGICSSSIREAKVVKNTCWRT